MGMNQLLGAQGEELVVVHLQKLNYEILDRNWRIKEGEIDIVAKSPENRIVFVEVKTRSTTKFGYPIEAIDEQKAQRLQRLALAWLSTHNCFGFDFRLDVAGVIIDSTGKSTLDYRISVL